MASTSQRMAQGALVGAVSGLVGSWLMLQFIDGAGVQLLERLKTEQDHREDRHEQRAQRQAGMLHPESVTMQAADTFASHVPGGRRLSYEERKRGGAVVHYLFGTLMGVAYGTTVEFWELPAVGYGVLFGTGLWAGTDLVSIPAVGFAKWPTEEPAAAHVTHWMAHVLYGTGMEVTRRLLRTWLNRAKPF